MLFCKTNLVPKTDTRRAAAARAFRRIEVDCVEIILDRFKLRMSAS